MDRKIEFDGRITVSGSSGVAIYIPAHIVRILQLKDKTNYKVPCILDDDGDVFVYFSQLVGEE